MTKIHDIPLTAELTKDSPIVTTQANVANALTTIISIEPEQNEYIIWPNDNPMALKLYDSSGNEVEDTALLALYKVGPGGREEEKLGERVYAHWKRTAISDQFDPERRGQLTIPFVKENTAGVVIKPGERLELRLKSARVVDWDYASGEKITEFVVSVYRDTL
jgi:hypothetical protein